MRLVLRNVLRLPSSRGGLNLMEEKATKKMPSHSFTNLTAAQVGSLLAYVLGHVSRGGNKYHSLTSCFAHDLQMKGHCRHRGRPSALSSRLAKRVTHLKQKVTAQRGASLLHSRGSLSREEDSKSDCRNERKGRS